MFGRSRDEIMTHSGFVDRNRQEIHELKMEQRRIYSMLETIHNIQVAILEVMLSIKNTSEKQ